MTVIKQSVKLLAFWFGREKMDDCQDEVSD